MGDSEITWLHLSDLHCCDARVGWDSFRVLEALRADLVRLRKCHDLQPQFLLFTGDFVFGDIQDSPISDQFGEATEFIAKICDTLDLPPERVFLVPGNHDVARRKILASQTSWLKGLQAEEIIEIMRRGDEEWSLIQKRLSAYRNFVKQPRFRHLLADDKHLNYCYRLNIDKIEIGIAGLDSAWSCSGDDKGNLWLGGEWQLAAAERSLAGSDISIGLIHHPLSWFSPKEEPENLEPHFARIFDFHLHGHEHKPWVHLLEGGTVRIAAGACYNRKRKRRPAGYNIVRLDFKRKEGEVWLRRYQEDTGDWIPYHLQGKTTVEGIWHLRNLRCFSERSSQRQRKNNLKSVDHKDRSQHDRIAREGHTTAPPMTPNHISSKKKKSIFTFVAATSAVTLLSLYSLRESDDATKTRNPAGLVNRSFSVEIKKELNLLRVNGLAITGAGPAAWDKKEHTHIYIADGKTGYLYSYRVGSREIAEIQLDIFSNHKPWPQRILNLAWHGDNLLVETWNAHFVSLEPDFSFNTEYNLRDSGIVFLHKSPWIASGSDSVAFALRALEAGPEEELVRPYVGIAVAGTNVGREVVTVERTYPGKLVSPFYDQVYPLLAFSSGNQYILNRNYQEPLLTRKRTPWGDGEKITLSEDLDKLRLHTEPWQTPRDVRNVPVVWGVYAGTEGDAILLVTIPASSPAIPSNWCFLHIHNTSEHISLDDVTFCYRPKKSELFIIPGPAYWLLMEHTNLYGDPPRFFSREVEELIFVQASEITQRSKSANYLKEIKLSAESTGVDR